MERNLRLYLLYQACRNSLFWLPVFFLYFSSLLPLDDVLLLEGIYYLAVVLLEVPSGYFSDRIGRRPTLLVAAASWTAAGVLFASTGGFASFAGAQVLLACGMAFNSGTDTSLLFDSLASLQRASEIGRHEARAHAVGYFAAAAAALAGGAIGGFSLRAPYVLFGAVSAVAFLAAWRFEEPPRVTESAEAGLAAGRHLAVCLARLSDPVLLWIFVFVVGMTVLNHVPYEFVQPYLAFLLPAGGAGGYAPAPAAAGVLAGAGYLVSSVASALSMRVRRRLGVPATLLASAVLQGGIILVMGTFLHPIVVGLLLLRSVPGAVLRPVTHASIHPRIRTGIRATYLSLQSLAGRLAFSSALFLSSLVVRGTGPVTREAMSGLLIGFAGLAALLVLALAPAARAVGRRTAEEAAA